MRRKKEIDSNLKEINHWLNSIKFEKQLIGGVSEKDVWKKILQLNKMYEEVFNHEKEKYDTSLESKDIEDR